MHRALPASTEHVSDATSRGQRWLSVAALASGLALLMVAYFPAQGMAALGDRLDAVVTMALGLGLVAIACAMAVYDTTRRILGHLAGAVIAVGAATPLLSAMLMPVGSDLARLAYYVCAIGLVSAMVRRSAPATVFGLLTVVPMPFYVVFGRALGQAGI